jgi:23S rRNA (pseudouridine1915-N3)-methyltransferase
LEAADDYLDRLSHYARAELIRLREGTMAEEAEQLLGRITPRERVIVLDERGENITTERLVARIGRWSEQGHADIAFLIGGADGLHPDVKARANETMALSALTLPHRLAQVMLLEQLYRAHTILRGEKYHRA